MRRQAFTALKLCCWITSLERRAFSGPYEAKDCVQKFEYFLPRFSEVLADADTQHAVWEDEYRQVRRGAARYRAVHCGTLRCNAVHAVLQNMQLPSAATCR